MQDYQYIQFTREGAVATLTLNRPEALNALTFAMMAEALDALRQTEQDPELRALILTGAGRGFCSGQDLRDRVPPEKDLAEELMRAYFPVFQAFRRCQVPVIVAVNGTAAGGGFSLALTGDILLAASSAKFIQVFSRIGLAPDLGSSYLLPKAIGRSNALKMMMTNDALSAGQALDLGVVSEVLEDDALLPRARELAAQLAKGPTHALVQTRALLDRLEGDDFETQFRAELEMNGDLRHRHDAKEGVAAFLEKRPALFKGL
ncbi:enoyl-CoA hydratase/isomerase family protein [Rhodovibrionaceae bacterium A322]